MPVFEAIAPTRLGPESNGVRMTLAEFEAVDDWDDAYRYELIAGVVIVSPPPSAGERGPNELLGHLLWDHARNHPEGPYDDSLHEQEIVTKTSLRRADRVIWTGLGRTPRTKRDLPTIAIEFVSRTSRDRKRDYVDKRSEYAEIGIAEYWVIDRFDRTMTVCLADGTDRVVAENETYSTDVLPGFVLPLGEILAAADRYEEG